MKGKNRGRDMEIEAFLIIGIGAVLCLIVTFLVDAHNQKIIVRDSPQDIYEECQRCRELEQKNKEREESIEWDFETMDDLGSIYDSVEVQEISLDDVPYTSNPDIPLDADLQKFVEKKCEEYSVSYPFVLAIMESESTFREEVGNEIVLGGDEDGYYFGYMQLSADNCKVAKEEYGLDAHTPEGNIEMAIILIQKYINKYGEINSVINAYKAGEGAADSWVDSGYKLKCCDSITDRTMYWNDVVNEWENLQFN